MGNGSCTPYPEVAGGVSAHAPQAPAGQGGAYRAAQACIPADGGYGTQWAIRSDVSRQEETPAAQEQPKNNLADSM